MSKEALSEEDVAECARKNGLLPAGSGETGVSGDSRLISKGLTKRELFAAMAMQGLCANPGGPFQANGMNGWSLTNCDFKDVANTAAQCADALLKELAK